MFEQRLRERGEPTDAALERIGLVLADDPVCLPLVVGLLYGDTRAECDALRVLPVRINHNRLFDAALQLLGLARVSGSLRLRQALLKLLETTRRYVVRVASLRFRDGDLRIALVFFYECAAHGTF